MDVQTTLQMGKEIAIASEKPLNVGVGGSDVPAQGVVGERVWVDLVRVANGEEFRRVIQGVADFHEPGKGSLVDGIGFGQVSVEFGTGVEGRE